MEKNKVTENTPAMGGDFLTGDFEFVEPQKRGILFIEARMRDDLELEVDSAVVFHLILRSLNSSTADIVYPKGSKRS
jgi:hypothetical protein